MNPFTARVRSVDGMLAALALVMAVSLTACRLPPGERDGPLLTYHLAAMDDALARGDAGAAVRARHAAYAIALDSRRWEDLLAVGDATARLAELPDQRSAMLPEARRAYLGALFRARDQRSPEGVAEVAEAFVVLGDPVVAERALSMASALAGPSPPTRLSERLESLRLQLEELAAPAGPSQARTSEIDPAWLP